MLCFTFQESFLFIGYNNIIYNQVCKFDAFWVENNFTILKAQLNVIHLTECARYFM